MRAPDPTDQGDANLTRGIATLPSDDRTWAMRAASDDLLHGRMPTAALLYLAYRQAWAIDRPGT